MGKEVNIMRKIAVASDNGMVTGHFGHCEAFIVFHADGKEIVKVETIASPGHRPGFLPLFLAEQGVDVIISGGMGGGAVDLFNEKNIEVIIGAQGTAQEAGEAYLNGSLLSTGSICHEHQHHEECGTHSE